MQVPCRFGELARPALHIRDRVGIVAELPKEHAVRDALVLVTGPLDGVHLPLPLSDRPADLPLGPRPVKDAHCAISNSRDLDQPNLLPTKALLLVLRASDVSAVRPKTTRVSGLIAPMASS